MRMYYLESYVWGLSKKIPWIYTDRTEVFCGYDEAGSRYCL